MNSLSKWIAAPALAIGLLFAGDAPKAKAQFGLRIGGGHGISIQTGGYRSYRPYVSKSHGYGLNHGYGAHYGGSIHGYRSYYGHQPWFHDTSHYDYHPTEIYRHGNHYDVVPGHFDLHRTGHWHH